jgi:hypothetical protein
MTHPNIYASLLASNVLNRTDIQFGEFSFDTYLVNEKCLPTISTARSKVIFFLK